MGGVVIGVARETASGERRVALTPETCSKLIKAGARVQIEPGIGDGAGFMDDAYNQAGAQLKRSIAIRVVDVTGSGVADAAVVLSPSGGALSDSAMHTDSLGVARTQWTLGHSAGEYTLAIHLDGLSKLVKLTARATPAGRGSGDCGRGRNFSRSDPPANGR